MSESSRSADGQGNGEAGLGEGINGEGINGEGEPIASEGAAGEGTGDKAGDRGDGGNGGDGGDGGYGVNGAGNGTSTGVERRRRRRKRAIGITAVALVVEMAFLWQRGYGIGGNVVVRCRDRHLFTTIWIPGVSLKSLRLGFWRVQYCPVGKHWSLVVPAKRSALSATELQTAGEHRDIRIP